MSNRVLSAFVLGLGLVIVAAASASPASPASLFFKPAPMRCESGVCYVGEPSNSPLMLAQRASPPVSAATATTETLGAPLATDGWCVPTNGTTALDLDAAAPARVTAAIKNRVRFFSVKFVGTTGGTSTRVCHRVGGALVAAACNALDADAVGVLSSGESGVYAIARDFSAGGLPEIEAQANAGSDGAVCVTIGW